MNVDEDYIEEPTEIIESLDSYPPTKNVAEIADSPVLLDDTNEDMNVIEDKPQWNLDNLQPISGGPPSVDPGPAKSFQPALHRHNSFFTAGGSGEDSPLGDYSGDSRPESPSISTALGGLRPRYGAIGRGRSLIQASNHYPRSRSLDPGNLSLRRVCSIFICSLFISNWYTRSQPTI